MPYDDLEKRRAASRRHDAKPERRAARRVRSRNRRIEKRDETLAYKREWARLRYAENRARWFAENGPCVQCGSDEDLQMDHIDPATKVAHNVWLWAADRRAKELEKCQVLCKSCHLAKTRVDLSKMFTKTRAEPAA